MQDRLDAAREVERPRCFVMIRYGRSGIRDPTASPISRLTWTAAFMLEPGFAS
jgi:hypothetical protein